MSKINKIKVKGEVYSINDLATQEALNSEVERAYTSEENIKKDFEGILAKVDDSFNRLNTLTQNSGEGSIQEQINKSIENKQDKLISGVNIKTVNGESILGSGEIISDNSIGKNKLSVDVQNSLKKADTAIQDISGKQNKLISGNNIKTINGLSLMGSGNIDLETLSGSSSADIAPHSSTLSVESTENNTTLLGNTIGGDEISIDFPAATTEKAGVMTAEDKKEQVKKTPLINGDIIVGQTREIYSRQGKTVTDSFLARTTAGSGTIGDGVASLKSVGGNIVKNLVDGTFESGWDAGNGTISKQNGIVTLTPNEKYAKIKLIKKTDYPKNVYYQRCAIRCTVAPDELEVRFGVMNTSGASLSGAVAIAKTTTEWHYLSCRFDNEIKSSLYNSISIVDRRDTPSDINATKCLFVNLTEIFGAGQEPSKEECDKLFGVMDALPQGLSIAKPTEFKSTGFNQFNPNNVLDDKAIVDNTIVSGDKKIAVIPCLPCKVGTGENNGYCIHGDFGDDIKVYLTPLNPLKVEGELYMHELAKDATTDTYVPQIKGYMLVEVPTTANLCAHFLWSEDKCERDSYEPYFESKIELPVIPQMSEWGLAGISKSNIIAQDTIDLDRMVYTKRIVEIDLGFTMLNRKGGADNNVFWISAGNAFFNEAIKTGVMCGEYTSVNGETMYYNAKSDDKLIFIGKSGYFSATYTALCIRDSRFTDATALQEHLKGIKAYYYGAEEEYPLPKVDNNYISSDYGVEQFDSVVPCNANNLYYMRSLAGETRNFLDRLYDNTDKTDAKEVADYITNGIENNKELATNAPNLALRALFVAAGAEYNDTDSVIEKTAPWGTEETWVKNDDGTYTYTETPAIIQHLPKHYYLNGLGDITEEQMMDIYKYSFPMLGATDWTNAFREVNVRTNLFYKQYYSASRVKTLTAAFNANKTIEILNFNNHGAKVVLNDAASWNYAFGSCTKLKRILGVLDIKNASSLLGNDCDSLIHVQLYNLNKNLRLFNKSSNIDKESVLYAIQNASPTSVITITLHPDAYARIANQPDILEALEAQPLVTLVSA